MRCLLLSAYHAPSHAYWCEGLQQAFPQWHWQLLTLPARYFNWRIRGNALHLAYHYKAQLEQPFDLIIATSMTDLAGLRSFCPRLSRVPSILYFHENQFEYPGNQVQAQRLEPQMMTLYSALSADLLLFNSHYNRTSFLAGTEALLNKLPDCVPPEALLQLRDRSQVLPVPLKQEAFIDTPKKASIPTFIWNHRWEHDKAPERLLAGIESLLARTSHFKLHVVGQQFRRKPDAFDPLQQLLHSTNTLGEWGFQADPAHYRRLLMDSHAVISTALHDFQGLAVLEAVAAGCVPLTPQRLAYPEWFSSCYDSSLASPQAEAQSLATAMAQIIEGAAAPVPDVSWLSWDNLAPEYERTCRTVRCR